MSFNLPAAYKLNSMELEVAVRLIAGSRAQIRFHFIDTNNHLSLRLNIDNTVSLVLALSGVFTSMGVINNVIVSRRQIIGIRTVGSRYEVFINGNQHIHGVNSNVSVTGTVT